MLSRCPIYAVGISPSLAGMGGLESKGSLWLEGQRLGRRERTRAQLFHGKFPVSETPQPDPDQPPHQTLLTITSS